MICRPIWQWLKMKILKYFFTDQFYLFFFSRILVNSHFCISLTSSLLEKIAIKKYLCVCLLTRYSKRTFIIQNSALKQKTLFGLNVKNSEFFFLPIGLSSLKTDLIRKLFNNTVKYVRESVDRSYCRNYVGKWLKIVFFSFPPMCILYWSAQSDLVGLAL